ncbi:uncharacterized protein LAESUDRAFT_754209 [Laetiporus sulphureus 93-53]|uniref:SH3 domain-containing protein n=1 Tax=Laetiporus sulphureus 93-53 TaxID=1314785 RepID=A0A165IKU0_9APHY|nr:uncharacterized protein LAESUDRAFT_754209 [Laetiporus sulphureus 93-53]KZT13217.1 hypothetical protein LAESUDRAFT_754209 [Laetiporus sulphureus 93-53]
MQAARPSVARQDTFDLRDQILADDHNSQVMDHVYSDEEHSVLEDDSDTEDHDGDYMDDDDGSSSLSIPNESIDFDLVYALHSFAATVEGQANVVKGDSLFLMDDSNSYWWLVRVLKTQEVGYIPAENIETPFERLARLNKHRNVDLASATQAEKAEKEETLDSSRDSHDTPSPATNALHRYPPAVWGDEEDEDEDVEWDDEGYEDEDPELAEESEERERAGQDDGAPGLMSMEPDDGMSWEEGAVEEMQAKERVRLAAAAEAERQRLQQEQLAQRQQEQRERELQAKAVQQQSSREEFTVVDVVSTSPSRPLDPAQVTETRKISMTPPVARVDEPGSQLSQQSSSSSNGFVTIVRRQSDERKRSREEQEAQEDAARKRANVSTGVKAAPVSSSGSRSSGGAKLRKERDSTADDEGGKEKDKKKKGGSVFGSIFGRKKDKDKGKDKSADSSSGTSGGSIDKDYARESEESGKSLRENNAVSSVPVEPSSPVTAIARQQQNGYRASEDSQLRRSQSSEQQGPKPPPQAAMVQISQHASQLRQRDQQQQALYQQYLNRSPSSPPDAQPSYGLQSASAVLPGSNSFASSVSTASGLVVSGSRARPGSLVLSPSTVDGQGVGMLPDLSVVRVFAGENLQTEATFKTVLLNASTTASDLVRQAIQRFRLPAGEEESGYYLTIKQVEGSSATLLPHEKPLGVFESLVEAALELPKVKRSSVGSISSVASNLSMHPAIKKLPMNDFTDDSAVKFYLNRKGHDDEHADGETSDSVLTESPREEEGSLSSPRLQYLSVGNGASGVTERFSSPSYRFALQLVIYPDDLPDDMVFDPLTEAIVFKDTLRDRPQAGIMVSSGISQAMRKKVFVFPKNVTVAEVIELGLERFGILDGVVDGGDEIEDKLNKRRSSSRVRYGLAINSGSKERELSPSSKVIEAFPRPPAYRAVERQSGGKRRSIDSAQLLLGNMDDVQPDDPIFILRRAVAYRTSTSRHRLSAPLDEIALQHLHRDSVASSSVASDSTAGPSEDARSQTSQTSKQAIIAAQRAATRASQRAILSAQPNSARGLDVLLPGNALIRSSRYELDDRMRYSYVEPDGETYDISEIVEEEWRSEVGPMGSRTNSNADDLLHGVLARGKDGLGAKLERVLSKIKHEKGAGRTPVAEFTSGAATDSLSSALSTSPSVYSTTDASVEKSGSRTATPIAQPSHGRSSSAATNAIQHTPSPISRLSSYRTASSGESDTHSGTRSITPNASQWKAPPHVRQNSALSDVSVYRTATPNTPTPPAARLQPSPEQTRSSPLVLPRDDFGLSYMMALIDLTASENIPAQSLPQDSVDELLFGKQIDTNELHPQVLDIYSNTFKQLDEMDEMLDKLLHHAIPSC